MAQLFNMRSTANVLAPLLYSAMYEYGLSINKPSFLPLTFCTISLFAESMLQSISKEEMDSLIKMDMQKLTQIHRMKLAM